MARELNANIAIVQEAVRICEAQLEVSTGAPDTVTDADVASGIESGGASGQDNRGRRIRGRDILALKQELNDALGDLEESKARVEDRASRRDNILHS
ncbi:hypothetical protein RRG08_055266 [Elysia crispata]|uniref:Uncharacterized protein n=1 Tax=Elysia crispata TaxID=231223 RepID=A0AAE0ZW50_9GAST|nr:hypothetical protein RRG08_055266 [Elysia crispata]